MVVVMTEKGWGEHSSTANLLLCWFWQHRGGGGGSGGDHSTNHFTGNYELKD